MFVRRRHKLPVPGMAISPVAEDIYRTSMFPGEFMSQMYPQHSLQRLEW